MAEQAGSTTTCRDCLATIPAAARKCQHCGSEQSRSAPAVRGLLAFAAAVLVGLVVADLAILVIWG